MEFMSRSVNVFDTLQLNSVKINALEIIMLTNLIIIVSNALMNVEDVQDLQRVVVSPAEITESTTITMILLEEDSIVLLHVRQTNLTKSLKITAKIPTALTKILLFFPV